MTGNEPSRIPNGGENADSWSHERIYDAFHPLDRPDSAHASAQDYDDLASNWGSAVDLFAARIHHSSSAAWQGTAAEAARTAIANYANEALDLVQPLNDLAGHVSSTIDGIQNTRLAVQKPPDGGSWYNPRSWNLGIYHGPSSAAVRHDCENAAREAMQKHYVNTFVATDRQIPILPIPTSPTTAQNLPPQPVIAGPSGPSGPGPSAPGPAPATGPATGPGQQQTGPSSRDSSTLPSSLGSMADQLGSAATQPSSLGSPANPSAATTPSSYGLDGLGGLGGGGMGGPAGGGLGGLGDGTPGSGGAGRSVPGTAAAAKAAGAAAAAERGAAAAPGMPGMGGMGGKGKSEQDKDHELPEWLRTMEHTRDLLGPEIKTVPGGVIGGDYADPGSAPS